MVIAAITACDACNPATQQFTEYVPPVVHQIAINPAEGVAANGTPTQFRVDAWDIDGNYIWLEDRSDITVTWSAELEADATALASADALTMSAISLTPASGNPTTLTIGAALPRALLVKAVVNWSASQLEALATLSGEVPTAADRVTVKSTGSEVISMLDACWREGAASDPAYAVVNRFLNQGSLEKNMTETACTRPAGYAIFSPDYRMVYKNATLLGATKIWTHTLGDELNLTADSDWKLPDEIDLYLHYFVDASPDPTVEGETYVKLATELFKKNRSGIQFNAIPPVSIGSPKPGNCDAGTIADLLAADGSTASEVKLHVFFVNGIEEMSSADGNGKTCGASPGDGGRFILIDWNQASVELLAHEIGHALGHMWPNLGSDHVYSPPDWPTVVPGFKNTNLMHESKPGIIRDQFTVGQVFRMNVDAGSWYQYEPGIIDKHPKIACGQYLFTKEPCPSLDRHPPGGDL